MGRGYSLDLRDRVGRAVVGGQTVRAAAARFEVSVASVVRWSGLYRANGSAKMARQGRPCGGGILAPYVEFLTGCVDAKPDVTLVELVEMLEKKYGLRVALGSVWRVLCKAGYTYKKTIDGQRVWTR
jgi:transposase